MKRMFVFDEEDMKELAKLSVQQKYRPNYKLSAEIVTEEQLEECGENDKNGFYKGDTKMKKTMKISVVVTEGSDLVTE